MSNSDVDPEKGAMSGVVRPLSTSMTPRPQSSEIQANNPLELFQSLVGIHTPAVLAREKGHNISLYASAKQQARSARLAYTMTGFIANSLYMLQILFAAIFTGLSAYKKTTAVTLTTLGAVNTVIAGSLAWQKGQGVPMRYRKARDQFEDLILEIEMTERAFVDPASAQHLDPRAEAVRLQGLYDVARKDQQANYPDLYVSTIARNSQKDATPQQASEQTASTQVQK